MLRKAMKLRGRSVVELRERFSQAAHQWLERHGVQRTGELSGESLTAAAGPDDGGPVVRGPFFASLDDRRETLGTLRAIDPEYETTLRSRANRILDGRYDLLGHADLTFGSPVDWWLDPIAGVQAPDAHWSAIAFLDPAVVGDHKLVWELGRHRGMVTLGQAFWCTGDQRYADGCAQLLEDWMDRNPPKRGVHWASSLEVAFRSIAWLWILALIGDTLSRATRRRATGYLVMSARHVEQYLSTWFSPNTHLTGEALALFMIGTALPQCREASRWKTTGERILLEWLPRHVRPDGTYVEQSSWYHRYTTDFYLTFLVLAERSGLASGQAVREPLGKLLDVLAWLTRPDGTMPLIGDDDGGRLLFLDENPSHITRGPLATGAAILGRADFAAVAQFPTTELAWLLGPSGLTRFRDLKSRLPEENGRGFIDGGLFVIRSGWDRNASVLAIDAGPHGFLNAGHSHADALSVDITLSGKPVFVDPGTYTYTLAPEWRKHFRSTAAHCAVTIEGEDSAVVDGPFSWRTRCESRADAWAASAGVVLFSGTHDGFQTASRPILYRRSVIFLAPSLWIVRDEVDGDGPELAVHWQCAGGIQVRSDGARAELLLDDELIGAVWTLEGETIAVTPGWVSPVYGRKHAAPHLVMRTRKRVINTLLAPSDAHIRTHVSADGNQLDVVVGNRSGSVLFRAQHGGDVATDALLGWVERDPATKHPVKVVVAGATTLQVAGVTIPVMDRGSTVWPEHQ